MFSAQKNGTSVAAPSKLYVEDVFSTWLYTGNNTARSITNGVDLAGSGGMVWIKSRTYTDPHALFDTARGVNLPLSSNTTGSQTIGFTDLLTGFASTGFNLGADASTIAYVNGTGYNFASWTFRKAPKFFDVVTYVGNGATSQTIAHSLGVTPGCIIVKRTDLAGQWAVYHRTGTGGTTAMFLNTTAARTTSSVYWNNTIPTSTEFTVGVNSSVNAASGIYVAYVFAHDAAADGIIQCGSYTGNGSTTGPIVTLGWEPQWVMIKRATGGTGNWIVLDNMRGIPVGYNDATLTPNANNAESSFSDYISPTSTGFQIVNLSSEVNNTGNIYSYIAIRRPMKTPTLGTSVFSPVARTGTGVNATVSAGFVTDAVIEGSRTALDSSAKFGFWNRPRSIGYLISNSTSGLFDGDTSMIQASPWDVMDGYKVGTTSALTNASGKTLINWMFRRAPGFFDQVSYDGTGVARTINHNLGVVPELMIVKVASGTGNWAIYSANLANTQLLHLNTTSATISGPSVWNSTTPNATTFTVGTSATVNAGSNSYIAYLFASCPNVSKVGSYTGNGSSQTIDCGFAAGARFVLIKRTDSTGDWYVWDTARGIVAANDPHLSLNTGAAEVTTDDTIDPDNSGFIVNQVTATSVNITAATYIYLAIA